MEMISRTEYPVIYTILPIYNGMIIYYYFSERYDCDVQLKHNNTWTASI